MYRIALYPGSFDPITNGHVDIALRATRLFDLVVVGIYEGHEEAAKRSLFTTEERKELAQRAFEGVDNIRIDIFSGLTVDYASAIGAQVLVRGLRAVSDFEYEVKLAHMYRRLDPGLEIVCLMTSAHQSFVSSSFIKEVAALGGNIRGLVPDHVVDALADKYGIQIAG